MVCFQSEYIHVEYHAEDKILVCQWYGGCSSLQYRQALIKSIRYARQFDVDYAIFDRRLLPPIAEEDFDWTLDFIYKTFHLLPLKRFASVSAFDVLAERQQQIILRQNQKQLPFEMRSFGDLTSAYEWLVSHQ